MRDGTPTVGVKGGVRAREGARRALDAITLDLATGELFGSLGPNGGARSSTLEVLSVLLGASTGAGRSASRRRPPRGRR